MNSNLSEEVLKTWKVKDLQDWLCHHNLKKSGRKHELVQRIITAVDGEETESSDSDTFDDDTEEQDLPDPSTLQCWEPLSQSIPCILEKDIDNYFLYRKNPTTGVKAKFQRHMKKAKKFKNEKHVTDVECHCMNDRDVAFFKCKVKPSMKTVVCVPVSVPGGTEIKKKFAYETYVCLLQTTGKIQSAQCNCPAGVAGLCAHVGALLYYLVEVRNPCTSAECSWIKPRPVKRQPSPKHVCEMNFSNTENVHRKPPSKKPFPDVYQAGPCKDPDKFLEDLLCALGEANATSSVLYKTLRTFPADISNILDIYNPPFNYSDFVDFNDTDCIKTFQSFFDSFALTEDECSLVEEATQGQSLNQNWVKLRRCLLTSSNFGKVVSRRSDTPPDVLVGELRGYKPPRSGLPALNYGLRLESVARKDYVENHRDYCGTDVNVVEKGLVMNPKYPFLGTSVDGIVSCADCGHGLIEIKCPYSKRDQSPVEASADPAFCCTQDGSHVKLKPNHPYFYQVQGGLAITGLQWAHFVVWTQEGIAVDKIEFNPQLWEQFIFPKLKAFYMRAIIPELFSSRVQRGHKLFP